MDKRTQHGFTLYELLITVLIVGVVLTVGVPNMLAFSQNSRMTSSANDLHSAFHLARAESGRAKTNITICASTNPLASDSNCSTSADWDDGFIVFIDTDGNINRSGSTETVLRASGPVAEGITLAVANDATYFSYASTGLGRPNVGSKPAVTSIVMCDERGLGASDRSFARLLVATPLGRATVFRDKTIIDNALTAMSKSCP